MNYVLHLSSSTRTTIGHSDCESCSSGVYGRKKRRRYTEIHASPRIVEISEVSGNQNVTHAFVPIHKSTPYGVYESGKYTQDGFAQKGKLLRVLRSRTSIVSVTTTGGDYQS